MTGKKIEVKVKAFDESIAEDVLSREIAKIITERIKKAPIESKVRVFDEILNEKKEKY